MSTILTIKKSSWGNFSKNTNSKRNAISSGGNVLSFRKKNNRKNFLVKEEIDSRKILKNSFSILIFSLIFSGVFYLYQVNDLTNKGYEVKEIERDIAHLKETNDRNRIKEVELRSMYHIEKSTKELNLVSLQNISYLELDGPMAMK